MISKLDQMSFFEDDFIEHFSPDLLLYILFDVIPDLIPDLSMDLTYALELALVRIFVPNSV
jgi:hypothetical protein